MDTVTKYTKGQYGYRNYRKKVEIGKVLICLAFIMAQLAVRAFVEEAAWKNILTVMAILSVLPMANVASPLLASFPYRTPDQAFYRKASGYEGRCRLLYDLILTSREHVMPMEAVAVHQTGVFALCTARKLDLKKSEGFLKDTFTGNKLDLKVKILLDENAFFHRLDTLKQTTPDEDDGQVDYAVSLLKSLSM